MLKCIAFRHRLSYNAVALPGNLYINNAINGVVETVAYIVLTRVKEKYTHKFIYRVFPNISHVLRGFLDEMSAYALGFWFDRKLAILFTVPKINCVACAWTDMSSKNHLKNVTNIWKHTIKTPIFG